jgi:hypothetical protein
MQGRNASQPKGFHRDIVASYKTQFIVEDYEADPHNRFA